MSQHLSDDMIMEEAVFKISLYLRPNKEKLVGFVSSYMNHNFNVRNEKSQNIEMIALTTFKSKRRT